MEFVAIRLQEGIKAFKALGRKSVVKGKTEVVTYKQARASQGATGTSVKLVAASVVRDSSVDATTEAFIDVGIASPYNAESLLQAQSH